MSVSLDDKYELPAGRVYLTGIQALVRLPLDQRSLDMARGLATSGYISGYRGSPLGGYDQALWRAQKQLKAHDIHFEPGLNEDLAATAIVGTQQVRTFGKPTRDGVFGLWYGKNPGVDRSGDIFKHANSIGVDSNGGVLAVVGDDHAAKSSDNCNQSEQALIAHRIPVLAPSDIQEVLDYGLFGWALSRFSGLWVGLKVLPHHMDCASSIEVGPDRGRYVLPQDFELPPGGLGLRWPDDRFAQEERLLNLKIPAAQAFVRASGLDRTILDAPGADFGIMAAGKVYQDVLQALDYLGIDAVEAASLGIRLYKPGMVWPLEPQGALRFASGLTELLVVEEKEPVLESQMKELLYAAPSRPRVLGKKDENGRPLFPAVRELDPVSIAQVLADRLLARAPSQMIETRLSDLHARAAPLPPNTSQAARIPYFCAGCPHSRSLKTPEGSRALGGIGCHWMAVWTPQMRTEPAIHMGGEGANWIGQARFTESTHAFQNLGDGTYFHSGSLAIRAAVIAGVNITYKILYNDAVAMTGGQPVEGHPGVESIVAQLFAEGVRRVDVVSEFPDRFDRADPNLKNARIHPREKLLEVEKELSATPGVTAIIFDQTCAAEKRRRRKRDLEPTPQKRLFINSAVCEGCGDCGVQSNCVAIEPLETEFGRKRVINQTVCNQDFSCVQGFCPSFVSVTPGTASGNDAPRKLPFAGSLPPPSTKLTLEAPRSLVITGIGGTGVVTVGALLGMAAHIDGLGVSVLDSIGLAQKNGAVVSYVKIAATPAAVRSARIAVGEANALIGCDLIVAAEAEALSRFRRGHTRAVVNQRLTPTAQFVHDPDMRFDADGILQRIAARLGPDDLSAFDAHAIAEGLFSDSVAANLLMLGYAYQIGLVPLSESALHEAIRLNGVAVEMNRLAFDWGRKAALDLPAVEHAAGLSVEPPTPETLEALIERRASFLTDYQDRPYADRYRDLVGVVGRRESGLAGIGDELSRAVAEAYFKLLAYKDEYEVARLLTAPPFRSDVERTFGEGAKLRYHMAPPFLAPKDPATGAPRKVELGAWMEPLLHVLTWARRLRGTPLDVFGRTAERRTERALIAEFEAQVAEVLDGLTADNHGTACDLIRLWLGVRGYGHVKMKNLDDVRDRQAILLRSFRRPRRSLNISLSPASATE